MEGLSRLVAESLARHGFDRPLDYRRLHWSRWFRCESLHSLLVVPSRPGVFALAEEIADLSPSSTHIVTAALVRQDAHVGADAFARPAERSSAAPATGTASVSRRMLAIHQFFEDDDMAFVLDRMMSHPNPMRDRVNSGRYFVRYVVIENPVQRRDICAALNQWIVSTAEKATGIAAHFAGSSELGASDNATVTSAPESLPRAQTTRAQTRGPAESKSAAPTDAQLEAGADLLVRPVSQAGMTTAFPGSISATAPQLDSGAATNIHCPSPFPSGF